MRHFFINHMYSCFQGCYKLICAIFFLFCYKKQTLWTSEIWCRFVTYMCACKHVRTWLVNFPKKGPGWIGSPWNTWSTFEVPHISNTSQVQQISSTSRTTYLKYISSTANLKYISSTTEISSISQKYNNSQVHLKYNISQVHLKSIHIFQVHLKYEVFSSIAANHDCPDSGWKTHW